MNPCLSTPHHSQRNILHAGSSLPSHFGYSLLWLRDIICSPQSSRLTLRTGRRLEHGEGRNTAKLEQDRATGNPSAKPRNANGAIKECMIAKNKSAEWKPLQKRGDVIVITTFLNPDTFHQVEEFIYVSPALRCLQRSDADMCHFWTCAGDKEDLQGYER
ncbi:uncharacterized protein [Physcomitrium patens]|uniref:uncharacterized protein n=1 Tax=Physcomitrium patens TaxID=3218 RepID=UPI000D168D63|nr:uncharacterized protein LOC112294689 [Physcomitrium patens]|eukprot:XP_024401196.1 uncharacterized protein LOC112294689 [Physcomitrella patens]